MKIVIVDDEPGFARRLADGLGAMEFGECFPAASAEEAVEIVNREGGVDVLVTHVFMDGIDGFTLYETIRPHLPDLHVVFLSEYDIPAHENRGGGWPILPRSVESEALAFAIRHLSPPEQPAVIEPVPDPLVGQILGNYRIDALLGSDLDGNFYHAVQTNIDRAVELHALDAARAADPAEVARFLASARTKANVHHPALLSVFEAGELDGIYFYTSENRTGSSLAQLEAQELQLEPRVVFQLLHSVAEVMVHIAHEKIPHESLRPEHVLVDHRMRTRLVNIAVSEPSGVPATQEMQALAAMVEPVLARSGQSAALQQLLFDMESDSVTLRSWNALLFEVKRCASGAPSHRLDAGGRAAIEAVGAARKRQRMTRQAIAITVAAVLLGAAGFWAWSVFKFDLGFGPHEGNPERESMIHIPAGEFVFQDGRKVSLPDFWIDKYEVTIGQYADFLAWAETHPGPAKDLVQAGMPAAHSYVPVGWADEKTASGVKQGYHSVARAGGIYDGAKLTLDSPVFGVDWFDAFAYATWKNHRLPSDEEWEKAVLGDGKKKYPWGDEWKPGDANISGQDGFPKWSAVDAVPADRSASGLIGTAGNVSEWTLTVAGDGAAVMKPIIRGGNWSDASLDIRRRLQNLDASENAPTVGFRTASDKPPHP